MSVSRSKLGLTGVLLPAMKAIQAYVYWTHCGSNLAPGKH